MAEEGHEAKQRIHRWENERPRRSVALQTDRGAAQSSERPGESPALHRIGRGDRAASRAGKRRGYSGGNGQRFIEQPRHRRDWRDPRTLRGRLRGGWSGGWWDVKNETVSCSVVKVNNGAIDGG